MSQGPRELHYSYPEYLRALADSQIKLQYDAGDIVAMVGGTPEHAELAAAMIAMLRGALPCRVATSDLKVYIEALNASYFPDASVVCGVRRVAACDPNAILNPTILVEVTSDSTEAYDRGTKLAAYQCIPTLQAVIFVSHRRPAVTVVERSRRLGAAWWGWEQTFEAGASALARGHGGHLLSFDVAAIYAGIDLA